MPANQLTVPSLMVFALRGDTSRHDAGRSLYGRSTARLPTGPASWSTRQGTSPIMVLKAQGGCWLLPTSWPAWPAYTSWLPDASGGYRVGPAAPDGPCGRRPLFARAVKPNSARQLAPPPPDEAE